MTEKNIFVESSRNLTKATLSAVGIAAVALVTVILPAEYNIDPTGIGHGLGLTTLATTAETAHAPTAKTEADSNRYAYREDRVEVVIPPGKGVEYKFQMDKYSNLKYEWTADNSALFFDFHGEPEGDTTGYFESFTIATSDEMKGSLTTPFAGSHGWYWKNRSDLEVTVTLATKGNYEVTGLKM